MPIKYVKIFTDETFGEEQDPEDLQCQAVDNSELANKGQETKDVSPLRETLLSKFSSKFGNNQQGNLHNTNSINNGDLPPITATTIR